MREKNKYDSPFDRAGRKVGLLLTIGIHTGLLALAFSAGLKYVYPPPPEQGIEIEFVEPEEPKPIQAEAGIEPKSEIIEPEKEIKLVQKSESPIVAKKENIGDETTIGDDGDIEQPAPKPKKEIKKRALFSSAKNKPDTTAIHTAEKVSNSLKAGHAIGNTETGATEGSPQARLKGRNVMGILPIPSYSVEKSGRVVVRIMVDQEGKVSSATPGMKGTTVQDATLWKAAQKAALKARFNTNSSAPIMQEGTITYVFKLR